MYTIAASPEGGRSSFTRVVTLSAIALAAWLGAAGPAQAKDAVRATITEADGAVVTENGAFLTPGTYAIGTIRIDYFVSGYQFPADLSKTFTMCLDTLANGSRPATVYPATVTLAQIGSTNVMLAPSVGSVTFASADDDNKCLDVSVTVPDAVASDPAYQADGTELVGILQMAAPGGSHLDTVTTIKVHLTLVHPLACLRALHFALNQDFTSNLGANGIGLSISRVNRNLNSNPVDVQHMLVLVNTCDLPMQVDVLTGINENFALFQANAVRTTTINQELASENDLMNAGLDWNQMSNVSPPVMCLQNVTVPAGQSLVLTERVRIRNDGNFPGAYAATINRAIDGWSYDGFSYATHYAGGACAAGLSYDVMPNEGEIAIPVNQVGITGQGAPVTEYAP